MRLLRNSLFGLWIAAIAAVVSFAPATTVACPAPLTMADHAADGAGSDDSDKKEASTKKDDAEEEKDDAKDAKDAESKEAKDESLLVIRGADIHTISRGLIRRGTIVVRDGKIEAIGRDEGQPDGEDRSP